MFNFFKKRKERKERNIEKVPEINSVYFFIPDENTPFPGVPVYVTVIDVKDGFVKTKTGLPNIESFFSPRVIDINLFNRVYRKFND